MRLLAAALYLTAACGPSTLANTPPEAKPSDEPWVKEHVERVDEACDCETSACLDDAKKVLDQLEAAHGGLDESPADVHRSRGRFEGCHAKGTKDPIRDLKSATDLLCRCSNAACVDKALIGRINYEEKYGSIKLTNEQAAQLGGLNARFDECERQKIVSAEEIAAHARRVAAAVCACAAGEGCGLELTGLPPQPTGAKVTGETDELLDRIKATRESMCNCAVNGAVIGTYGGISTQTCPKK